MGKRRLHGNAPGVTKPFCFYKIMDPSTLNSNNLRIPENFAKTFEEDLSPYCILKVPTGVTHLVELVERDNTLWFANGWEEFVKDYSIGLGYFMLFIYDGESNFRVSILDLTACEISYGSQDVLRRGVLENEDKNFVSSPSLLSSSASPTNSDFEENLDSETESAPGSGSTSETHDGNPRLGMPPWLWACEDELQALADDGVTLPTNPFFVVSIKQYSLSKGNFMLIPIHFVREHLKCRTGDYVTVKIADGRQWEIGCSRESGKCTLSQGWKAFAQDISLEVGDVCLFELTDVEKTVLELHVVKAS